MPRSSIAPDAVRIPEGLKPKLAEAAEANDRSVAEEVRQRLEASFADVATGADQPTRELLNIISGLAAELRFDPRTDTPGSNWTGNSRAYTLFFQAVIMALEGFQPVAFPPVEIPGTGHAVQIDVSEMPPVNAKLLRQVASMVLYQAGRLGGKRGERIARIAKPRILEGEP